MTIVMKFGGTSVGNADRLRAAAALIKREVETGNQVAVVVSAMAGTTNELITRCLELSDNPDPFEYDAVISSGEQISSGLLALALQSQGLKARSFQGWQIPILVDHEKKGIISFSVNHEPLAKAMKAGEIPVIAGFQGIDGHQRIATLGRGGSDATAVAVASALKADRCDIYTDVEGVYSGDPRMIGQAQLLSEITFEEMLEFAQNGAKVLQPLSVRMAMQQNVSIRVLSAFTPPFDGAGTQIISKKKKAGKIIGISSSFNKAMVVLCACSPSMEEQKMILQILEENGIKVEGSFVEDVKEGDKANWHLFMSKEDAFFIGEILAGALSTLSYDAIEITTGISKITAIGYGASEDKKAIEAFMAALRENKITSFTLVRDNLKICAFTPQDLTSEVLCSLHRHYGLDKKEDLTAIIGQSA